MRAKEKRTGMTEEQEKLFHAHTKKKLEKYFWAAVIFVLLFQVYNILYALYYTDFRLDTQASRVYMCLYIAISAACIAAIGFGCMLSVGKKVSYNKMCLNLYTAFGCVLILWSVCMTIYDQRVSDNLSIYMTSAIYVAGLIYMKPQASVPLFIFCQAFLLKGFSWTAQQGMADNYGKTVNTIGITLVAMFISLYRYSNMRQEFLYHLDMELKNKEILAQSEKLSYMARHDALTGLWNRNYLMEWTEQLFRSNKKQRAAAFMIDIDFFKQYNDVYGHTAGDECLQKVALAMKNLRGGGILFRFGGEEFLYMFLDPKEEGGLFAEELRRCVEGLRLKAANPKSYVTVSVGFAEGSMDTEEEYCTLLRKADEALYCAKSSGRNRSIGYERTGFLREKARMERNRESAADIEKEK